MNKLSIGKTNQILDYVGILVFVILIIYWCDLDIQGWIVSAKLNTNIRLGLVLCLIVITGLLVYIYVSQILGVLLFIIILLITKAMLGYTELFTTTTTSTTAGGATTTSTTAGGATKPSTTAGGATKPSTTAGGATTTSTTNPNLAPISEFAVKADEVQQFLLRQIADDPNTTTVDKRVMADLTTKYFKTSSKLAELRGFNIASETANMLPGQQIIVGVDTVRNQH